MVLPSDRTDYKNVIDMYIVFFFEIKSKKEEDNRHQKSIFNEAIS